MHVNDWLTLAVFLLLLVLLTKPLGNYLCQVLSPQKRTLLDPFFKPLERWVYRICSLDPFQEQSWKEYFSCVLGFSLVSALVTFLILATQYYLPFNPQKFPAPSWSLNLHTSISFMTNTNWQNYSGESTLSYFSQMAALTVQNFFSPAVGLAVAASLVRGIARKAGTTIGNFWADITRIILYVLLPLSILIAAFFISQGVPQNFNSYAHATTLEGMPQIIAQGPIASQEAIKILGSNGGGFTNVNSAHPYENPTPLTNFVQILLILLIPAAQLYYFGKTVGDTRHAWYIFIALAIVLVTGVLICTACEVGGNPAFVKLFLSPENWEGKEQRFGLFDSALFACCTTSVACGAVNCMHDSLTPIGGLIPLLNIDLGEIIFGGVGAGLYGVLIFIFLTIFISGLIIGRTPEYLGKKIETFDIKMTMLAILPFVLIVHLFTSWTCFSEWGTQALRNSGPHGFTELLYAFSSCSANNGSAFAGLSANTVPYNLTMSIAMLLGRFLVMAPAVALAGSLVEKKAPPKNLGSFPVSSLIFISVLIGVILLVGALTFLPAITMGPFIEHFFLLKGTLFP